MKKRYIILILSILCFFQLTSCNFRTVTKEETINHYQNNQELFEEAIKICQKYDVNSFITDYDIDEELQDKKLLKEEKQALKSLIRLNCRHLFYNRDKQYINFYFARNGSTYQGIMCILPEASEKDIEKVLRESMPYEKDIEFEELDEMVYYYFLSGGRATESEPGTVNGEPLSSLPE